jgi:hypothetical protein
MEEKSRAEVEAARYVTGMIAFQYPEGVDLKPGMRIKIAVYTNSLGTSELITFGTKEANRRGGFGFRLTPIFPELNLADSYIRYYDAPIGKMGPKP